MAPPEWSPLRQNHCKTVVFQLTVSKTKENKCVPCPSGPKPIQNHCISLRRLTSISSHDGNCIQSFSFIFFYFLHFLSIYFIFFVFFLSFSFYSMGAQNLIFFGLNFVTISRLSSCVKNQFFGPSRGGKNNPFGPSFLFFSSLFSLFFSFFFFLFHFLAFSSIFFHFLNFLTFSFIFFHFSFSFIFFHFLTFSFIFFHFLSFYQFLTFSFIFFHFFNVFTFSFIFFNFSFSFIFFHVLAFSFYFLSFSFIFFQIFFQIFFHFLSLFFHFFSYNRRCEFCAAEPGTGGYSVVLENEQVRSDRPAACKIISGSEGACLHNCLYIVLQRSPFVFWPLVASFDLNDNASDAFVAYPATYFNRREFVEHCASIDALKIFSSKFVNIDGASPERPRTPAKAEHGLPLYLAQAMACTCRVPRF